MSLLEVWFNNISPKNRARLIKRIAETGDGTDECLQYGFLPMPVHFYSPVPEISDLEQRRIWDRRSDLAGLDLKISEQLDKLENLGRQFGSECQWAHHSGGDATKFSTDNSGFSFGCAASTHSIIRAHKPRKVIEIGSGSSSRVIAAALRANLTGGGDAADYCVIDPYPNETLTKVLGISSIVRSRVELTEIERFQALEENDVLFVDSGHTVRIGGDVNFLILDVLANLKPGVIVHFHDIPMPYEYSETYSKNPSFRMFWTESYLLQAFLAFNDSFEIVLSMNFLMRDHASAFASAFPFYDPDVHKYESHSFWIRRTK
jgi:hypothetical protein